ncbi:hypothetical protein LSM04_009199 [Trypanosoma melophagium]|uniref:uncharacterized protein n=1 Tax=Trypanosoma melophagium TaxID=715481 RepID=UPI00351A4F66|nr:hypothetical protein LSM04_009199 [Trypanosoma melophagium]
MVEVIIDTNADIDVLLRDSQRISQPLRTQTTTTAAGPRLLLWSDVYTDETLRDLFQERLSSVMSAAKSQRAIHFPRERLIMGSHEEVEIDILAPHLRILPAEAIRSKNKQEGRKAAFKGVKVKALEEHREKMLRLAMRGIELPRGGAPKTAQGEGEENVDGEKSEVTADKKTEEEKNGKKNRKNKCEEHDDFITLPPPPPPPPMEEEEESSSDDDDTSDEDSNKSENDEDLPPPPLPEFDEDDDESDDDVPPPPPE